MSRRLLLFTLAATVASSACTPPRTRVAPFRSRPDAVGAGQLRGPFDGKVIDAASRDPVAGALVYATWTFRSGYGMTVPAGYHEHVVSTNAAGKYRVPSLKEIARSGGDKSGTIDAWLSSNGSIRLTDFHLVVYKRGFVAYRSDRRFSDFGPRLDFAQTHNVVVLERWRSDFSHARHLRYVGGGPAIASLTSWETAEAAAELSGRRADVGPRIATDFVTEPRRQQLVAAQLLTAEDIKTRTDYEGGFETGPLNDEPDTRAYSSQHFQAVGLPQAYDLAIRLWTVGPVPAQRRYGRLLDDLPGTEEYNELGDRSLRAEEQGFFGVAFLDARRGVVVLLTCGKALCENGEVLVDLARTSHNRLRELSPPTDLSGGEGNESAKEDK